MLFPMYVVHMADFLRMREVRPHQSLRADGLLFEFTPREDAVAVFVSHQWCGLSHPDPNFLQLPSLQSLFIRAAAGLLTIEQDCISTVLFRHKPLRPAELRDCAGWYLWYDYFSVPQPGHDRADQKPCDKDFSFNKAISSLAAYVSRCKYFMVLAPAVVHEDGHLVGYGSWKTRGWCRFERLARVMTSSIGATVLLVAGGHKLVEVGGHEFMSDPVGRGSFAVAADRERLLGPVSELVTFRLRSFLECGDMRSYMRLMSRSPGLLDGLSTHLPGFWDEDMWQTDPRPAESFLKMMRLPEPDRHVHGAWPLLLATYMGNTRAMRDLLRSRADIACVEARKIADFFVLKGQSAAHVAATCGHVVALELLLELRADLRAHASHGFEPIHTAALGGHVDAAGFLIEHRADLEAGNHFGMTPLCVAVNHDRPAAVEFLLGQGAARSCNDEGLNALHCATVAHARPDIVRMLVDAGVSPHDGFHPRRGAPLWFLLNLLDLNYHLGRRDFSALCGHHIWDATPLMGAAMYIDVEVASILLRARADPDAHNAQGATAAKVAEAFGASAGVSNVVPKFLGLLSAAGRAEAALLE